MPDTTPSPSQLPGTPFATIPAAQLRVGDLLHHHVPAGGHAYVLVARAAPVLVDLAGARPVAWGSLAWLVIATATLGLVLVGVIERIEAALATRRWA